MGSTEKGTGLRVTVQQAVDSLAALGTSDDIATYLITHNYTGPRKMAARCPISRYIRDVTGESWVTVGHNWANAPSAMPGYPESGSVQLPENVRAFLTNFDRGRYDDLIDYEQERRFFGSLDVANLGGASL